MSSVDVKVRGLPELAAGMHKLAGNIGDEAERSFGDVADSAAGRVSASVPRRTGKLAGSVEGRTKEGGALVEMGVGVEYARFVEYGGRGHPHSGTGNYLYPVAMGETAELVAAGTNATEREIARMTWPSP